MNKPYEAGDKVFVMSEQRLATVLNVYGDGINGSYGDMRLDLSGNTPVENFEHYDPIKHAAFDHTFIPIKAEWKENYGITKNVQTRDQSPGNAMLNENAIVTKDGDMGYLTKPGIIAGA